MEVLRTILESLRNDSRRRSMILTQFGGFMGTKELILVNKTYGHMIGEKLKAGEQGPIEIEMTWQRKGNPEPYHTYLSTMACQELKKYFESSRGYPKQGEPIWYSERAQNRQDPLIENGYRLMFMRLMSNLGFRPPHAHHNKRTGRPIWSRYGVGPHELRDLAISQSERAISDGFNPESAEYFAGHIIDPLGYRKLHGLDPEYRRSQYSITEKYLDPFSETMNLKNLLETQNKTEAEIQKLRQELAERDRTIEELKTKIPTTEEVADVVVKRMTMYAGPQAMERFRPVIEKKGPYGKKTGRTSSKKGRK